MSQRYQREIEEILDQVGELSADHQARKTEKNIWGLIWVYARQSLGGKAWSFSPGRIILVAVSLLLLALISSMVGPGIGMPLALAGLLLFIVGYALFFVNPPKIEKRWRGQLLEDAEEPWWSRLTRRRKRTP